MHVTSHPVWVRGLKLFMTKQNLFVPKVAPRVGAWIETSDARFWYKFRFGRTPCGCVD